MTTEAPKTQKKPRRKRKNTGWVPDQHGAWVMVTVPLLLGVGLAGPSWIHLPLAVAFDVLLPLTAVCLPRRR